MIWGAAEETGRMSGTDELDRFKFDLWSTALVAYQADYKELADAWSKMDTKAQGTAGIAGVFLAAIFASARSGAVPPGNIDRALLGLALLCLVVSIVSSALALRVQPTASGPRADEIERAVRDTLAGASEGDALADLRIRFFRSQINTWRGSIQALGDKNLRKARHVLVGQLFLLGGAVLTLGVTLRILLTQAA